MDQGWVETVAGDLPAWRHEPSGVEFRLVPGGTFRMGLSDAEVTALRELIDENEAHNASMRPVRLVTVEPFLLARHPLTVEQVRHWLPDYEDDYADDCDATVARMELELHDLLPLLPFRLPSEAEWEYAARARTTTLTWHGNDVPDEDELLYVFDDEDDIAASENAFGLAAMGSAGEICADNWLPDHTGAPSDARPRIGDGPRVVRGGAADVSPWQDEGDWLAMLSAARMPQDMFGAIRPAVDVTVLSPVPAKGLG